MLLHETTGLRRYDAAVLSLTHMDFALGSAVRLPGTTEQGLTVQLPPLVKTEALWSLGEESGKKTLLLGVRFYKNDHFAETGSGQKTGRPLKKEYRFLAGVLAPGASATVLGFGAETVFVVPFYGKRTFVKTGSGQTGKLFEKKTRVSRRQDTEPRDGS